MADIPESTKSEHVSWTVNATSYLRNLDSEDLDAETIAVHYQKAPEKTETGTRISLCFPTLIVSGYCSEPREVADRVARILNAHWDEPAAPPAMDREAAYRQALEDVCNPLGYLQRMADAEGAKLSGMAYAIASDIGTIQHIAKEALSTLSADAIRQGEGSEVERFREAIVTIIGRCEALEDEASDELAKDQADHAHGFYRGQKSIAKSLRRHLADLARPITPASHASDGGKA
ncbi:hypothetical protein [Sphingomonas paucimobilis]|uniref:hypothetical protein n=1 Tax=Sphingomonas paucimobilis TaxID=13689 RepID=UPI0020414DC4|nr:hypothetical protein [Sphingomonas paucimobilis]MCM3679442.1 hypothetical protein [Sphingomonas paucimobilis]